MEALLALQGHFYALMRDNLSAFASEGGLRYLLAMAPAGVALGLIHALTPGHGKSLLAVYAIGSGVSILRSACTALLLAAIHIGSAVVLALIASPLISRSLASAGRAPAIEQLAGIILISFGIWMMAKAVLARPHNHQSGFAVALGGGLAPCPITLMAMIFAISRGVMTAGIAFALFMLAGIALTLCAIAVTGAVAGNRLRTFAASRRMKLARAERILNAASGVLIAAAGVYVLTR